MQDLINAGTLDRPLANRLEDYVLARKNILISGGTGTGKTTLLNILGSEHGPFGNAFNRPRELGPAGTGAIHELRSPERSGTALPRHQDQHRRLSQRGYPDRA
jgi:ABC-type molybdenum transport system ATPase subunit/photorepair protein PhrA